MSAFLLLILCQQTEERERERGAFWVVLQVSLASADTCCEQHTARFSGDIPLREAGAGGIWGRTVMTKCFFSPIAFFYLRWTCLHSSLLLYCHIVNKNMHKVSG